MQVVDPFDDAILGGPADGDVVEHREVLDVLTEADPARVRTDRDPELGGQQDAPPAPH